MACYVKYIQDLACTIKTKPIHKSHTTISTTCCQQIHAQYNPLIPTSTQLAAKQMISKTINFHKVHDPLARKGLVPLSVDFARNAA